MKKSIVIAMLLILTMCLLGFVSLKLYIDDWEAAEARKQSKYDIGPPDPQEMLELVNAERARAGVAPLMLDENVQKSAQLKADDMAAKGYRHHEIPGTGDMYTQEMRTVLYGDANCVSTGENLAYIDGNTESASVVASWMSSKSHREAIQDPGYHRTGFGVKNGISVQHFCKNK